MFCPRAPAVTQRSGHSGKRRSKGADAAFAKMAKAVISGLKVNCPVGAREAPLGDCDDEDCPRGSAAPPRSGAKHFYAVKILKWAGFACPFESYQGSPQNQRFCGETIRSTGKPPIRRWSGWGKVFYKDAVKDRPHGSAEHFLLLLPIQKGSPKAGLPDKQKFDVP